MCVDALMGFGPGQRVLMGLMLGERELQFVPPSERQRQMSAGPAARVSTLNIHTHTDMHTHTHSLTAERCVCLAVPHRGRRMKTHKHTLSLCPFVEFQELSET